MSFSEANLPTLAKILLLFAARKGPVWLDQWNV